jgi:conjugal transfer pilus assembly protein TrbC
MPTDADIAKQQADFAKTLRQVPQTVTPTNRLGPKLNAGDFAQPKIDPQEIAKRYANAEKKARPHGVDLMVFVSFSMPTEVITELSRQAKQYGATMMLRGFADDSLVRTQQMVQAVNVGGAGWQINPDAFKIFKIDTVPAVVLATGDANSILEQGCAKPANYVAVTGNQSLDVALQTIRRRSQNSALASDANKRLSR